jgi:site-specific DNA-cytosine methylase
MSETYPFIDCQGLAGAWTLGTVETGRFELAHRVALPGGFGNEIIEHNRHLIPGDWEQETGSALECEPRTAAYLCGTPPCSGFSVLNQSKGDNARGPDSAINHCMKELVTYAARCTGYDGLPGPEVVSFESVQGAFSSGRDLMQRLRAILSRDTGLSYGLTHVKMSGSSVGAAQMRHRYYFVAHRIPFGVDPPEERPVVTYEDAIGDLVGHDLTWDDQPYRLRPSEWARSRVRADGQVGDHITVTSGRNVALIEDIARRGWDFGDNLPMALKKLGLRPPELERQWADDLVLARGLEAGAHKGWNWPVRVKPNRPGYVLTGGGIHGFVHWAEPRHLTVRECARLMGYPDVWDWGIASTPMKASLWIGKCCPVDSGRWISNWVARALDGNPGEPGREIGDQEWLFNCTNDYKNWPNGRVPKR